MMRDIQRICEKPTSEDSEWFPEIRRQWRRDGHAQGRLGELPRRKFHSAVPQPEVIRDFKLFALHDESDEPEVEVTSIHNEIGYRDIRRALARHHDAGEQDPDIRVTDADLSGTRRLTVTHYVRNGRVLGKQDCERTLQHLAQLWGHRVKLLEVDPASGKTMRELEALPLP